MKTVLYLHTDRANMMNEFEDLCRKNGNKPSAKSVGNAGRVGYEIELDGVWNEKTGEFKVTHLMGTELKIPTKI